MKTLIGLILILGTQLSWAGDAAFYSSLGFSKQGNYYSYIQEGVQDGSGFFWMELGIIDVKANSYIGREKFVDGDEFGHPTGMEREEILNLLKQKLHFDLFGFTDQPRQDVKVSRPQYDLSTYTDTIFSLEYWAQGGASAQVQQIHLLLTEVVAPINQHNHWCEDWYPNNMIELKLDAKDSFTGPGFKQDLQIDTQQPEVRACTYDYQIRYVFVHEKSIATAIRFRRPGFEGPDERFMVVTAELNN